MILRDSSRPARRPRGPGWVALLAGSAAALGCSSKPIVVNNPLERSHENLMQIGAAYQQFLNQNQKPPRGASDLTPHLKQLGDPQELLRSPDDGSPYVICWGVNPLEPQTWAKSTPVLAYERKGSGGKRYVLTTMWSVHRLTDEEFRQASFPPGHKPPP